MLAPEDPPEPPPEVQDEYQTHAAGGSRNIVPGFVLLGHVRALAHQWAMDICRGTPRRRAEWVRFAEINSISPEEASEGWAYLAAHLSKYVQESTPYGVAFGGQYLPTTYQPHISGPGIPTSWPWRTKSAERVFAVARRIVREKPEMGIPEIYDLALSHSKISALELTPEDDALMSLALEWELTNRPAPEEPPVQPAQRNPYGMKGTNRAPGSLPPRGAP